MFDPKRTPGLYYDNLFERSIITNEFDILHKQFGHQYCLAVVNVEVNGDLPLNTTTEIDPVTHDVREIYKVGIAWLNSLN